MAWRRYLLFIGADYYPSGGWSDFSDSFDTIAAARDRAPEDTSWQWYHIVDSTTGQIIADDAVDQPDEPKPQALSAALVARAFSVMLPKHEGELVLEHNPQRNTSMHAYMRVLGRFLEFTGPLEQQKIEATDELWVLKYASGDVDLRLAAASLDAIAQWLEDNGMAFGS